MPRTSRNCSGRTQLSRCLAPGGALVGVAAFASSIVAQTATVTLDVRWQAGNGLFYPVRNTWVDIFTLPGGGPSGAALPFPTNEPATAPRDRVELGLGTQWFHRGTFQTDRFGRFTGIFTTADNPQSLALVVRAESPAGVVSIDTQRQHHYFSTTTFPANLIPPGGVNLAMNIFNAGDTGRAFGVNEAFNTSRQFAMDARAGLTSQLLARLPMPGSTHDTTPEFNGTHVDMPRDHWDVWDATAHEYGHFLAHLDHLDNSPGGSHFIDASNIPTRGKLPGARVAWSEGLATWMSISAQRHRATTDNLPRIRGVGDLSYTDPIYGIDANVERIDSTPNPGEGNEMAVTRILQDIADGRNEPHDRIARGSVQTYQDLLLARDRAGGLLETLHEVNDYYLNVAATTDRRRADYGAIFEKYGVSPHLTASAIARTMTSADAPPNFRWTRQNNGENESFNLIVWNSSMTQRLLDIPVFPDAVNGIVLDYTLSSVSWDLLKAHPGRLWFAMVGSDSFNGVGTSTDAWHPTGNYWSGAYWMHLRDNTRLLLSSGSGNWSDSGIWLGTVPNGSDAQANLVGSLSAHVDLYNDSPHTIASLTIDSPEGYSIHGDAILTLSDQNQVSALIQVLSGFNFIHAPLAFPAETDVHVNQSASVVIFDPRNTDSARLNKSGEGTLFFNRIRCETLAIAEGDVSVFATGQGTNSLSRMNSLQIAVEDGSSARLDLGDSAMIIDYGPAEESPIERIRDGIRRGYSFGWFGRGITSSTAAFVGDNAGEAHKTALGLAEASELGYQSFLGEPVDDSTLLIRYTLYGDATLDARVDTQDFNCLAGGFGGEVVGWFEGDFNYDSFVDSTDFNLLLSNYGYALPVSASTGAMVPEPALAVFSGFLLFSVRGNGNRRSCCRRRGLPAALNAF